MGAVGPVFGCVHMCVKVVLWVDASRVPGSSLCLWVAGTNICPWCRCSVERVSMGYVDVLIVLCGIFECDGHFGCIQAVLCVLHVAHVPMSICGEFGVLWFCVVWCGVFWSRLCGWSAGVWLCDICAIFFCIMCQPCVVEFWVCGVDPVTLSVLWVVWVLSTSICVCVVSKAWLKFVCFEVGRVILLTG